MKRGLKQSRYPTGFTIVEVMIVLAVTGFLFTTIALTWSGRQHKNEFLTAVQETQSHLQQVISDVQNGYFPSNDSFTCQSSTPGLLLSSTNSEQGTNDQCVFLGKFIQFRIDNTDPEQYRVYSVAGLRTALDLTGARPTVLAPSQSENNGASSISDLSEPKTFMYGVTTSAIKSGGVDVGAIGFLSGLGTQSSATAGTGYQSGAQQIDLYALKGAALHAQDSQNAAQGINVALRSSGSTFINQPVGICLRSGGTDQQALISIGQSGNNLSVDSQIMNLSRPNCGL